MRPVTAADEPFLERMMLYAGFPPGTALPPGARSMPHVRWFVDGWGRPGDVGVIAEDEDGPVGAAWARLIVQPLLPGVPEVAIAVEPDARNAGLGTALLEALHEAAGCELSLRVSIHNPAVRLYERAGYERVVVDERGIVMRRAPKEAP